jgi:poly(hydroxyalkanoate) depolymerase family esterase
MQRVIPQAMVAATRLTRDGRLVEATAAIQRALRGETDPEDAPASPAGGDAPIEVPFRVAPAGPSPARQTAEPLRHSPSLSPARSLATGRPLVGPALAPPARQTAAAANPEVWAGGAFLARSYVDPVGTRDYQLYIPRRYAGQPLPLLVMLHGCTQGPADFAAGTRLNLLAERGTFLVAYPAQAAAANPSRCWNWFRAADQARAGGEAALLAGLTRRLMAEYRVDPRRVYVAGLSAGGAMAAILGATHPDLFAAIGVHSGLAYGAARDLPAALRAMQRGSAGVPATMTRPVPAIVFHGDRDVTVHPRNGDQVLRQCAAGAAGLRGSAQQGQVAGGHAYTRTTYRAADAAVALEQWQIHGAGHAWSGGSARGSHTDPRGPDASGALVRFFLAHPRTGP